MRPRPAARPLLAHLFVPAILLCGACVGGPPAPDPPADPVDVAGAADGPEGTDPTESSDPTERARRILAAGEYQTTFPEAPRRGNTVALPPILARMLLFLGVGILVVLIVLAVVLVLRGRMVDLPTRRHAEPDDADLPIWARGDLGDVRSLAAAGRFAEAVHALLLQALRRAILRSERRFSDALTAREVVRGLGLPATARGALTGLLRASEEAWFGGKPAGEADFMRCRELYRAAVGPEDA